ncbi:efflux RND transporter periplasmic adaptor subunit [Haliea sp. E17]|uniref:efflux RND transporter periplasmic adaptor subunit n=1 Tax=Haliea sp. E17 TaxID=3401576 RepID=UPI003AAB909A
MLRICLAAPLALLLLACSEDAPPPMLPEVFVAPVVEEPYQPRREYVGRLRAQDDVAIQARVSGYVQSRDFTEGQIVHEGDVLYTLDSSEYDAALARARAELAAAEAAKTNADRNQARGLELLPKGAISQSEMDSLTAAKLDADARLKSAQAQVTSAEVNLGFTTIRAPITGRTGRSVVSVGDLVGPTTGDLTSLVSIDPIHAVFTVSEATYVKALAQDLQQDIPSDALSQQEVTLELGNGLLYPEVGRIDYRSNRVDPETGTLEARALIPNPHALLVPGQYVRVILRKPDLVDGLFVPQAAVQADQLGSFVLAVNAQDTVERRNVQLGMRMDDLVAVTGDIREGERVIVRGLQQVRAGMPVQVHLLEAPAEE